MPINKYTQPAKQTLVPTPMEQIWRSTRVMDERNAQSQQYADALAMNYFGKEEAQTTKRVDDQFSRFDKATEGIMGANLLLSSIPHIPDDKGTVDQERSRILGVLNDTVDKYGDNPYVLNSTVAAVVSDITRSMKGGTLKNVLDNVERSKELIKYHDKAMVEGYHNQASYQAAKEAAKNAKPFPTLKGISDDLSKQLSKFTMQNNVIDYRRVFEAAVNIMELDPRVQAMKTYMSKDEYEDYIIENARTYAMIEAGNRISGKGGSGTGSGSSGTATEPVGSAANFSFSIEGDYGKVNVPVITPRNKEANEEEATRRRKLSLKKLYSIEDGEAKPATEYLKNTKPGDVTWSGHVGGGHIFLRDKLGEGVYTPNFSAGEIWTINNKQYFEPMDDSEMWSAEGSEDVDLTDLGSAEQEILRSGTPNTARIITSKATGEKIIITKRGPKTVLRPAGAKANEAIEGSDFRDAYTEYIRKTKQKHGVI